MNNEQSEEQDMSCANLGEEDVCFLLFGCLFFLGPSMNEKGDRQKFVQAMSEHGR